MKKVLSAILITAVIMNAAGFVPGSGQTVFAQNEEDFGYTVSGGEATITGYWGDSFEVIIPPTIDGYPVTSIGDKAFYRYRGITSVTIPNGVKSIGNQAFNECQELTQVTIPDSVISIGERAFMRCCKLTSVTIPNSVTTINYGAFLSCDSLASITIPSSVTSIGFYAFADCENLESINVDADNPAYTSEGGVLFDKQKTILVQCPAKKPADIPSQAGLRKLGMARFMAAAVLPQSPSRTVSQPFPILLLLIAPV